MKIKILIADDQPIVCEGNIEIANILFITEGTVKNHVTNLLAKLGARDRTQLAILTHKNMT
jgi:DNA-binding NarL/FixJ family response regulator